MISHFARIALIFSFFLLGCKNGSGELKTNESAVKPLVFQQSTGDLILDYSSDSTWKVVHFWATWCKPCLAEFPELKEALPRLENDSIQFFIASDESLEQIQKFQEKYQTGLELLRLEKGDISDFGIYALPTTIVIDPDGKEVFRQVGQVDWSSIDTISKLIASKP